MANLKKCESLVAVIPLEEEEVSEGHEHSKYVENVNEQEFKLLKAQLMKLEKNNKRLEAQLKIVQVCV